MKAIVYEKGNITRKFILESIVHGNTLDIAFCINMKSKEMERLHPSELIVVEYADIVEINRLLIEGGKNEKMV